MPSRLGFRNALSLLTMNVASALKAHGRDWRSPGTASVFVLDQLVIFGLRRTTVLRLGCYKGFYRLSGRNARITALALAKATSAAPSSIEILNRSRPDKFRNSWRTASEFFARRISCDPFGARAPASQYFAALSLAPVHLMIVFAARALLPSSVRSARAIASVYSRRTSAAPGGTFVPVVRTMFPTSSRYTAAAPSNRYREFVTNDGY